MTNEIITALNDINGENTFKFQYGIQDEPARRIVILQVVYIKTGAVLMQTTNIINSLKPITPEQGDIFIREFNKQLMMNVLYSIETNGKIINPKTGKPITTFADIRKQQLNENDNANTTLRTREESGSIRRPNNGSDDGTDGIPTERLPRPDHIWN